MIGHCIRKTVVRRQRGQGERKGREGERGGHPVTSVGTVSCLLFFLLQNTNWVRTLVFKLTFNLN